MSHQEKKIPFCSYEVSLKSCAVKGFTLIELLVVIAVVGVLAGAVVVIINPAAQLGRARDAQRKSDIRQIANALEQYLVINGAYPLTGAAAGISTWCDTANTGYFCSTNPLQVLVTGGYLKKLPIDPRDNQTFLPCDSAPDVGYLYRSDDGVNYKILAHCGAEGGQVSADPLNDFRWHSYSIFTPGGGGW